MKVALIYLGRRGAGGLISPRLASLLRERDHRVSAYVSSYSENETAWRNLNSPHYAFKTYTNWFGALASFWETGELRKLILAIREFAPDVLLFPMFHPWNHFIQQALAHIPSVVFVHDPRPHPDLAGRLYGILEDRSIRQARRCVVMSSVLKPSIVRRGIDEAKVDVVPLGQLWDRSMVDPKDRAGVPTLLFFGRIVPYKGLEVLLDAYILIRKSKDCRLLIVGEGHLGRMRKKVVGHDKVVVVNRWIPEDEIESFFLESDVVVLPYTSATQSGVIPIAAAFEMPVVATSVGGLVEQIEDGVSGWLVPPGDVAALAGALNEVLSDRHQARSRGQALRHRYDNELSWERIIFLLEESMRQACRA